MLINDITEKHLLKLLDNPPHAILVTGEAGSGKSGVLRAIIKRLNVPQEYCMRIGPNESNVITIEQTRSIKSFLNTKVPNSNKIQRIIAIENAHLMQKEAQNSVLKVIEEPPTGTIIILTVTNKSVLIPTIPSRCTELSILPVSFATARDFVKTYSFSEIELSRLYALSRGLAGLFTDLLTNNHPEISESIVLAKSYLSSSLYNKSLLISSALKTPQGFNRLVDGLNHISYSGLFMTKDKKMQKKWLEVFLKTSETSKLLETNVSKKLIALDMLTTM